MIAAGADGPSRYTIENSMRERLAALYQADRTSHFVYVQPLKITAWFTNSKPVASHRCVRIDRHELFVSRRVDPSYGDSAEEALDAARAVMVEGGLVFVERDELGDIYKGQKQ